MWRNRHVVTALLVAPVLALIAYFAVDAALSPKAQVLRAGESYPLKEHSNCRRAGGLCTLSNNDLRLQIGIIPAAGKLNFSVQLNQASEQVLLAHVLADGQEIGPFSLKADNDSQPGTRFSALLDVQYRYAGIRLVATVQGANFFASPSVAFLKLQQ